MTTQSLAPPVEQNEDPSKAAPTPLFAGDRLSRAEFERRYEAHPEIKKAELIEGAAYMPPPVQYQRHANPHFLLNTWAGVYTISRPQRS